MARAIEWSAQTFGPGLRTVALTKHIRKELLEIEAKPHDVTEWIDVVILGFDGAWRCFVYGPGECAMTDADEAVTGELIKKDQENFARQWPDWRLSPAGEPIEHVRKTMTWGEANPGASADLVAKAAAYGYTKEDVARHVTSKQILDYPHNLVRAFEDALAKVALLEAQIEAERKTSDAEATRLEKLADEVSLDRDRWAAKNRELYARLERIEQIAKGQAS